MRKKYGWWVLLLCLFGITGIANGQGNLLEEQKRIDAVKAQQLEQDYKDALRKAYSVGKKSPAEAAEILNGTLAKIKESTVLSRLRRRTMIDALETRIAGYRQQARRGTATGNRADEREAERKDRVQTDEEIAAERKEFQRMMAQYNALIRAGRYTDALKLSEQISGKYGGSPPSAAAATGRIASTQEQLRENRRLEAERARRFELVRREVVRSAMPPIGDIEFPSADKWKRITKLRDPLAKLSARDRAILKALNMRVTVKFQDASFEEILDYIQKQTGQTINVSEAAMRELGVDYRTPLTVQVRGSTIRTLIRKVLGELGMAYYVKDGAINATSLERAREITTTRVYYLGDVARSTDFRFGPAFNQFQMFQNVSRLIATIVNSVEPESWRVNGGNGTIAFDPRTLSLIVRQTAEVHLKLGGGQALLP